MNVMTRIFNALAFANVGNQNEFNVLLRQVDLPSASPLDQDLRGSVSLRSDATSSVGPGMQHA